MPLPRDLSRAVREMESVRARAKEYIPNFYTLKRYQTKRYLTFFNNVSLLHHTGNLKIFINTFKNTDQLTQYIYFFDIL